MDAYDKKLKEHFGSLEINLVRHDTGSADDCLPCYIEVHLGSSPKEKDRGGLVLDLGNYIYRTFSLSYQMCPEFRGKGKKTTLRWFMSKDQAAKVVPNIAKALDCSETVALLKLNSLIIQNPARGVAPREMNCTRESIPCDDPACSVCCSHDEYNYYNECKECGKMDPRV